MNGVAEAGDFPYYVATQASATAGVNAASATYQYNFDTIGGGAFTSRTNSGSQSILSGSCGTGCSQGGSDANSTGNPLLTTSHDQASASLPSMYIGSYLVNVGFQGTASANANLAAGTIGVSATSQGELYGNQGGDGQATSYLQDQLNFHVAGADSNTITYIGVQFVLDGMLSVDNPAGSTSVRAIDGFGNAVFDYTVMENGQPTAYTPQAYTPTSFRPSESGWASYTLSDSNLGQITFNGIYAIQGADPSLGVSMNIDTTAAYGASSNYSDTNGIQLTLPTGVSFASDSGVFLTSPTTVPVPSAVWLFGSTIAGFGMYGRRKSANA
jgi:hypothetical protein